MFFQDNNKCLIYFQVKYCGWNYGCHCINLGRAERQSLENLFPWTKTPADIELWHAEPMAVFIFCSRSWRQQETWLPSPLYLPLPTGSNTTERALLKSVLCRQPQWGHKDNALKKPSPYKFQLHLQTWNFWGRDKMFVLATQSIYFSHTCCLPSKERGVLFFFFFTSNCIFV